MSEFEWLASESAPKNVPMQVVSGRLLFPDGGSLYIPPNKLIYQGWGKPVSTHIVGEDRKPIPEKLEIAFFSYVEDQFYAGSFPLEADLIQGLFAEGYLSHRLSEEVTYQRITVGVAPGGAVAVWLVGNEKVTEVFFGHAEPADLDFELVAGRTDLSRESFVEETLLSVMEKEELVSLRQAQRSFTGQWSTFHRKRYGWSLLVEDLVLSSVGPLRYFNGEIEFLKPPIEATKQPRAVPEFLEFNVLRSGERSLRYLLTFDQQEIFSAMAQLAAGNTVLHLVVADRSGVTVSVRGSDETVVLKKVKLKKYLGE